MDSHATLKVVHQDTASGIQCQYCCIYIEAPCISLDAPADRLSRLAQPRAGSYHRSVRITVNRRPEEFPEDGLSVSEVFARLRFSFPLIIARLNGRLVRRAEWATTMVREGDELEADHLIGGG